MSDYAKLCWIRPDGTGDILMPPHSAQAESLGYHA